MTRVIEAFSGAAGSQARTASKLFHFVNNVPHYIARRIGVDESRISDILRGKIESFTLDRLIGYAEKLHPGLRVQFIAA